MNRIAGVAEPILTHFSRVFLQDRRRIIEELSHCGFDDVLYYVVQQIRQFQRLGDAFNLQHQGSESN